MLGSLRSTLRALIHRDTMDRAMDDEFALHLELRTADLVRQGMSPNVAARHARLEFGNVTAAKERARASWRTRWIEHWSQDVRYALRTLKRNPGFTTVALLSLGAGIGATTTVFSVIDAVDFRPLPFRDAGRLVWLTELTPHGHEICSRCPFYSAPLTALDWAAQSRSVDAIAALAHGDMTWVHDDVAEPLADVRATPNFFPLLGVRPARGRGFVDGDALPGAEPVALISYSFWRTRLGEDSGVVGTRLGAARIVGVLPQDFHFHYDAAVWTPMRLDGTAPRTSRSLRIIGRLRPGESVDAARIELETIAARLAFWYPDAYRGWTATARPLRDLFTMGAGKGRFVLFAFTTLVLLIAVCNVAGLLLARAVARGPEFALRSALGASRRRLVGQMLVEGGCIGLGGGALGVVLAVWAVRIAPRWLSTTGTGLAISIDRRMLAFAAVVSIVAGASAAIVPAFRLARADLGGRLRTVAGSAAHASNGLITLQIAMALVLLTAAGFLGRDFLELRYLDLGYDPSHLYSTYVFGPAGRSDPQAWRMVAQDARARVAAIPGVVATSLEYASALHPSIVRPEENTVPRSSSTPVVKAVDAEYFRTFGTRLIAGRTFTAADRPGGALVAMVNKAAADAFWPGQNPIGRRVYVGDTPADGELLTVIGVAGNAERGELIERHWPMVYRPFAQAPVYHSAAALYVRIEPGKRGVIGAAQAAIREATGRPSNPFASAADHLRERLFSQQVNAIALELFAGFGLLLAAMGIYGSVAYGVTRRTREIGIRLALGAGHAGVVALVARRAMLLAAGGVAIGLVGALALTRVFRSLMVSTSATSPWIFAGASLVMIATSLVAALVPARRAARVDSVVALRSQ